MIEFLHANPWLLAIAIFVARILDVSIGTMRTIIVFRGYAYWAAALGFVEILIWLAAAGQVLQNLDAWYLAVAYAGGFAAGNVVGITLEARLAVGSELVRIVSVNREVRLASILRQGGHSVTELEGRGDTGHPVEVLLVVAKRRKTPALLNLISTADPGAVWTVSDVKRYPPQPLVRPGDVVGEAVGQVRTK